MSRRELIILVYVLLMLHFLFVGGLLVVLSRAQIVNFTLAPRPSAKLSTTQSAAGECPTTIASTHRSVVPARRGHLSRGVTRGSAKQPNPLAGSCPLSGAGSLPPITGASDAAAVFTARAAGQRCNFPPPHARPGVGGSVRTDSLTASHDQAQAAGAIISARA